METGRALIIACGALAREIAALRRANGWTSVDICCLPPELHNRPERIAPAVREKIRAHRGEYRSIFVAYGDCGTGGRLDAVLREEGVERLPGAHCYEFLTGAAAFAELAEAEPGTFYLTDFLTRHFERLVARELGLDRHPQLVQEYFRNYRKVIYLAQTRSAALLERARQIASSLGLAFEHRHTGLGELAIRLGGQSLRVVSDPRPSWQT
ncbi:MAG: DUF1638 domain-containing protein [Steroidobacteraceae bacterium]